MNIDDEPTILSFNDYICLMEKKYGKDWIDIDLAKMMVVWNSSLFDMNHVKEVCVDHPGLYELCEEYRLNKTIEGQKLPIDFYPQFLEFIESFRPKYEPVKFHTSPVRNAYWSI